MMINQLKTFRYSWFTIIGDGDSNRISKWIPYNVQSMDYLERWLYGKIPAAVSRWRAAIARTRR